MDQCSVQGESKTLIHLTLQKPEISAGSMGHQARTGFSFKISYSCMPNMQSILRAHNNVERAAKPSEEERKCNCRKKDPCQNECLTKSVVYKATVSELIATDSEKVYFGLTGNSFTQRYNGRTHSIRHDKHRSNTELQKFIWNLKDNGQLLLKPKHILVN